METCINLLGIFGRQVDEIVSFKACFSKYQVLFPNIVEHHLLINTHQRQLQLDGKEGKEQHSGHHVWIALKKQTHSHPTKHEEDSICRSWIHIGISIQFWSSLPDWWAHTVLSHGFAIIYSVYIISWMVAEVSDWSKHLRLPPTRFFFWKSCLVGFGISLL